MKIETFSKKQAEILKFICEPYPYLICDGAVRSGKTIVMIMSYIIWAMGNFDRCNFAICGKTVANAERNVLKPLQAIEGLPYKMTYKLSNRMLVVRCGRIENYFYLFGGKDESSYMLIQGITLAGVLMDEVALMPQSFVNQAMARTLTYSNAKIWFNCNPDKPTHWFYTEWIKKAEEKNAKHLHFLMTDNPILSKSEIEKAKQMYSTGVFYDRYILGLWVAAEGIVYKTFVNNPNRFYINKGDVPRLQYINIGVDFGGNKSAHAFVATGTDKNFDCLYVLKSHEIAAKDIDTDELIRQFVIFAEGIEQEYGFIDAIYPDSAEQTIITTMRRKTKYGGKIHNSIKNEIIDRIRCEDILFAQDRLKIIKETNPALIDGLTAALWDDKKIEDVRLDDGTSDIDILDAFEYSFERYIKRFIRGG